MDTDDGDLKHVNDMVIDGKRVDRSRLVPVPVEEGAYIRLPKKKRQALRVRTGDEVVLMEVPAGILIVRADGKTPKDLRAEDELR